MQAKEAVREHKVVELAEKLPELEAAMNYSLADAIREGSTVTEQCVGWARPGDQMCAMSAALLAVKARHLID